MKKALLIIGESQDYMLNRLVAEQGHDRSYWVRLMLDDYLRREYFGMYMNALKKEKVEGEKSGGRASHSS